MLVGDEPTLGVRCIIRRCRGIHYGMCGGLLAVEISGLSVTVLGLSCIDTRRAYLERTSKCNYNSSGSVLSISTPSLK